MMSEKAFDCLQCLGFCCSIYDAVSMTLADVRRLAAHCGIAPKLALKRFTRAGLVLRRKPDSLLGETCCLFDTEARRCSVYEARPNVCREWPLPQHRLEGAEDRCCYFDVYRFAQKEQSAANVLPLVQIKRWIPDSAVVKARVTR